MGMTDRDKVIKGLECCTQHGSLCGLDCNGHWGWTDDSHTGMELLGEYRTKCTYGNCKTGCVKTLAKDALALLKTQEPATVEPKRIELANETKAWLDRMDAVDALNNIADICIDWDGYRTADGLGGLINEIWAYARYCADKLLKAQEPRVMTLAEVKALMPDEVVYFQPNSVNPVRPRITATIDDIGITFSDGGRWQYNVYGDRFRLWTSRPTDAQMEAVKWE